MKYTVSVRWWLFYPYQSLLIFFARLMNVEPDWQKVGDFFTEILYQSGEDEMTSKLTRDIIQSEITDFFAGVVEIHTELGGPNSVEEAQNLLTERVLACLPVVDVESDLVTKFVDDGRRYVYYRD